jgi:hypothetical protein
LEKTAINGLKALSNINRYTYGVEDGVRVVSEKDDTHYPSGIILYINQI